MKYKIGFMQGRLLPKVDNQIQKFPKKNWQKEFKIAKKNHLDIIEWTIDSSCLLSNPILKKYNLVKKLLKKYNIKINSITCDFYMQKPIHKNNNKVIKKKYIKIFTSLLKTQIKLIIIPLVDNSRIPNEHDQKITIDFFENNVLPILKKYKKKILFEIDFNPQNTKEFIKKFSKNYFGINYDTGNSAALGYNLESEINAYGDYIKNIHIKDRKLNGKTIRLGHGHFQFKKLKKMLFQINYKNNLILQTARAKNNLHVDEIKTNLKFLKKYL